MNLKNYFKELQRRHVVKAGIAYLVVAWLIIQVLSILFPAFEASSNAMKTTILILGIGFPIWLVIAWVYDFSSEGIKKTDEVAYDPVVSKKKNIQLNRFIIGGLSIAVILLVVNTFRLSGEVDELREDVLASNFKSSIAVMALEDRSPNKDQEHLSYGISENIYDRLIKFKDLKVTPSSSSFYYKDKDISFDVIAKDLDVAYILEGSIIPIGDNYRISLRMLGSKDNAAVWTKTYDDKKENILMTFDDLAQNISRYLKLTVDEKDIQQKKVDPEAYDLYHRGWRASIESRFDKESIIKADSMLVRALAIDSTYAPIYAIYAQTLFHQALYLKTIDRDDGLRRAMRAAKRAYNMDPQNVLALNWCSNLSWHLRDVDAYQKYLDEMLALGIVSANVMHYRLWCYARTNQVSKGYPFAKKAFELDPNDVDIITQLISYEEYNGNFDEVLRLIKKIEEIYPDSKEWYIENLLQYYIYTGNFDAATELIKDWDEIYRRYYEIYFEGLKGNLEYFETQLEHIRAGAWDESWYNYDLATVYSVNGLNDKAFEHLNLAFDACVDESEALFLDPDLKLLHNDPRWDDILDRLGAYFNYDFKHKT